MVTAPKITNTCSTVSARLAGKAEKGKGQSLCQGATHQTRSVSPKIGGS